MKPERVPQPADAEEEVIPVVTSTFQTGPSGPPLKPAAPKKILGGDFSIALSDPQAQARLNALHAELGSPPPDGNAHFVTPEDERELAQDFAEVDRQHDEKMNDPSDRAALEAKQFEDAMTLQGLKEALEPSADDPKEEEDGANEWDDEEPTKVDVLPPSF